MICFSHLNAPLGGRIRTRYLPRAHSIMQPPMNSADHRQARFWSNIARKYAREPIADMPGYERTVRRVQELLSPHHEVLEIGCGTGSTALLVAPGVRRLVATDLSTEMIAIAREKQEAAQVLPQLEFRVADAEAPQNGHATYDAVLAFNLLHLMSNLPRALASVVDAIKPGGLFVSKTPCVAEMNVLIPLLALPLMRVMGKVPPVRCFDAGQLQAAMKEQGLDIVSVERHGSRTSRDIRVFIVARKPRPKPKPSPSPDGLATL